ncbi:unnamed protein product [Sphagnum balticum]
MLTRPFHLGFYPFLWIGVDIDDSCDDSDQFAFTVTQYYFDAVYDVARTLEFDNVSATFIAANFVYMERLIAKVPCSQGSVLRGTTGIGTTVLRSVDPWPHRGAYHQSRGATCSASIATAVIATRCTRKFGCVAGAEEVPPFVSCIGASGRAGETDVLVLPVRDLITDILEAMQSALVGVQWLDDEARSMATSKLAQMVALVGIRDEVLNLTRMDMDYESVGSPEIINRVVSFGALGSIIGHETVHAFDPVGIRHDSMGRERPWMNETIMDRYRRVVACIARHFSRFGAEGEMVALGGL